MTRYLLAGHSLVLDEALCNGCGRCVEVCPHDVFAMRAHVARVVGRDRCMECGACRMNCSENAITVDSGVGCAAALIAQMASAAPPSRPFTRRKTP